MIQTNIPLSLYIHFPWCVQKCPYCDFNSHVDNGFDANAYIDALIADFDSEHEFIQNRAIETIFMGGGTPSLFEPEHISRLLTYLNDQHALLPNCEITLEANPGTVEQKRFEGYRQAGINRLSIGIQSFNDTHLKKLGRIHDGHHAQVAIAAAQSAGFERINVDLMHGLPNQTRSEALADLQQAIEQGPSHISWYQLTLEPNTVFGKYPPKLPSDDTLAEIEDAGVALLAQHGYHRYEISGYCQNNDRCRHNMNYWTFGDYIGIGAGAHGKYTTSGGTLRRQKKKLPKAYLDPNTAQLAQETHIATKDVPFEYMLNRLRLYQPVLFNECSRFFSLDLIRPVLIDLEQRELIYVAPDHFQVTSLGYRFLNDVMQAFLAPSNESPQ